MSESLGFPRYGDKQSSPFFEDYLVRLLEERDRVGLTGMIRQIDALMITVEPGNSLAYVGELCLMTPYHYLVTLETEQRASSPTGYQEAELAGRALRALVKHLEGIPDDEISELNIPTGIPLVYELNRAIEVVTQYYLADGEVVEQATRAVKNQTAVAAWVGLQPDRRRVGLKPDPPSILNSSPQRRRGAEKPHETVSWR